MFRTVRKHKHRLLTGNQQEKWQDFSDREVVASSESLPVWFTILQIFDTECVGIANKQMFTKC